MRLCSRVCLSSLATDSFGVEVASLSCSSIVFPRPNFPQPPPPSPFVVLAFFATPASSPLRASEANSSMTSARITRCTSPHADNPTCGLGSTLTHLDLSLLPRKGLNVSSTTAVQLVGSDRWDCSVMLYSQLFRASSSSRVHATLKDLDVSMGRLVCMAAVRRATTPIGCALSATFDRA